MGFMITCIAIRYARNWEFPIQKKEWKTAKSNDMNIFCESKTIGQAKEFFDSSRQDFDTLGDQDKYGRIRLEVTN
jgi:hypothetical protein